MAVILANKEKNGEGGIRTRGTVLPVHTLSKRAPSATRTPLQYPGLREGGSNPWPNLGRFCFLGFSYQNGGSEIRTRVKISPQLVFETSAFNRSANSPAEKCWGIVGCLFWLVNKISPCGIIFTAFRFYHKISFVLLNESFLWIFLNF